jgi:hypothetical protein
MKAPELGGMQKVIGGRGYVELKMNEYLLQLRPYLTLLFQYKKIYREIGGSSNQITSQKFKTRSKLIGKAGT